VSQMKVVHVLKTEFVLAEKVVHVHHVTNEIISKTLSENQ